MAAGGAGGLRRTGSALPVLAALLAAMGACGEAAGDGRTTLVISAAVSMADAVTALVDAYAGIDSSVTVATNFGASGTLLQQVRQGAGVDLFLSASDREVEVLRVEGLAEPGSVVTVAGNALVLVVPASFDSIRGFQDLARPGVRRVAMGAPASVPAGAYARQTLKHLGLWEAVEPRVVYAASVRQALTYVEAGEVDAALVYRTDASASPRVRIVATAPPGSHAPIRYTAAVIAASENRQAAARLLDFISGSRGRAVLAAHGFLAPAPSSAD